LFLKSTDLSSKTGEITVLQGELEGLKKALDGASSKAKELSSLAEKAGQVEGVSLRVNFIDRKQINLLYS
jgi:hypothetical protein